MAFNLGRPCMIGGSDSIEGARELLKHPLSVKRDARLVASCELLTLRCKSRGRGVCVDT